MPKQKDAQPDFSDDEISRRRDAVIFRMANTPPQPKVTLSHPKKRKKTVVGRAAGKDRVHRER